MNFFKKLSYFAFFLLLFTLFFTKNVLAECSGQFTEITGSCTPECTNLYKQVYSKYDCPAGSPLGPDGQPDCLPEQRIFNCSFPLWYDTPSCTNEIGYNPCATTCGTPGSGACTAGNQNCSCGAGALCVPPDSNYSASQLCRGDFQRAQTNGGCVSASCGYFCYDQGDPNLRGCYEVTAGAMTTSQINNYQNHGAQPVNQCQSTCQICTPDQWSSNSCKKCNSSGTGFVGGDGSDWGTVGGNATQQQWCACAQQYGNGYNSTNYPVCFPSTSTPTSTPGPGTPTPTPTPTPTATPQITACSGGCGDSNYGLLGTCNGNWGYAANSSSDTWCQNTYGGAKAYCYTCTPASGGGPGGGGVCNPGQTTSSCKPDACTPGAVGNP
jgi:hypothetical protein